MSNVKAKIFVTTGIAFLILAILIYRQNAIEPVLLSPFIDARNEALSIVRASPQPVLSNIDTQKLDQKITTILDQEIPSGKDWLFAISVIDLTTSQKYGRNENEQFDAASVAKVPILASLYQKVKLGQINITQQITVTQDQVQDYGTGTIRYQKMPKTYSIKELSELMIKQSDNTAAYILARIVGKDYIREYVKQVGMINTDTTENTTTPSDTNLLFTYLYNQRLVDPIQSGALMKVMTDTDFESRLPGEIDDDVVIAHKIGTGVAQLHDAGIVFLEQRPYVIAVFSKRITDETKAEKIIAKLSRAIYDEFKQL